MVILHPPILTPCKKMLSISSLLIAFFATLGAIPMCRRHQQRSAPPSGGVDATRSIPRGAGAGMLAGVMVSLFYMDQGFPVGTDAVGGGLLLILVGAWRERQHATRARFYGPVPFEFGASVLAGVVLLLSAPLHDFYSSLAAGVFVALILTTPASLSLLSHSSLASPALPPVIVGIQLVLLAMVGYVTPATSSTEFNLIAPPLLGALMGVMLYLLRMPWRSEAAIALGSGARLCLGFVVAWAAVKLMSTGTTASPLVAVIWILSPPIFESIRVLAASSIEFARGPSAENRGVRPADYSPVVVAILAALLGGTGILLHLQGLPATWSLAALLPCLVLYVTAPILKASWSGYRTSSVVDATRAG